MATSTNILTKTETTHQVENKLSSISERVLQLISYFDSFDYPIKFNELQSLLDFKKNEIRNALIILINGNKISNIDGYYFIPGKEWTIRKRVKSNRNFRNSLPKILRSGWLLSHIPFVRGLMLTGSSSKEILENNDDFDFLVIVEPNHLWLCRTLIIAFRKLITFNFKLKNSKNLDCNYFLSENALRITDKNEFTAIEIFFAKPVFNYDTYQMFIKKNQWITQYFRLPKRSKSIPLVKHRFQIFQTLLETLIKTSIKIFYRNKSIEKNLLSRYYSQSLKRKNVSSFEEYKTKKSLTQIKNSNNTQSYMISLFRDYKSSESRTKQKTKQMRKMLTNCTY